MMNGIGAGGHAYQPTTSVGRAHAAAPHGRTESGDDVAGSPLLEPEGDEPGDSDARGVLRNLKAGHFRGVADVRLRVNFASQILAVELEAAARATSQAAPDFVAAADVAVDEFVEAAGKLTEEQQPLLDAALDTFATALSPDATAAGAGNDDPVSAFSESIAQLISTLNIIFAPPEGIDDSGAAAASGEVEGADADPDLMAIVDDLAEALAIALADFESSSGTTSTLPPLSSPSGNGVAYAKFLSEYNELYGTPDSEPSETPSIDIQA